MWFSGLRGAVAIALALELKDALDHSPGGSENGEVLVGTTFIIVLFTVFGLGCLTTTMLTYLKIEQGVTEPKPHFEHRASRRAPSRCCLGRLASRRAVCLGRLRRLGVFGAFASLCGSVGSFGLAPRAPLVRARPTGTKWAPTRSQRFLTMLLPL